MIEGETTGRLDFGTLRAAIEGCDPEAMVGFYSEDAELRIVHAALPEGPAFKLKGRSQIERYLRAVCDQEMNCSLNGGVVLGEGNIEFVERCAYPNQTTVLVRTTLELAGSLIMRQTDVVELAGGDDRRDDGSER